MKKYKMKQWLAAAVMTLAGVFLCLGKANAAGSTGDFTVRGGNYGTDYSYANHVLTVLTEMPLTVSGETTSDTIQIKSGINAKLTLDGIYVRVTKNAALDVQDAQLDLTVKGDNVLKSGMRQPGIFVGKEGKVVISGGKRDILNATGGAQAAGIGSNADTPCGSVEISSGTVYATGGMKGAGIGAGSGQDCGDLTFAGGRVVARGGSQAVDLGISPDKGKCGQILLQGGLLYADEISHDLTFESGILISGDNIEVQGRQILSYPLDIQANQTLLVPEGSELTIPADMECTNAGTIYVYGDLHVNGQILNEGEITDYSGRLSDNSGVTGNNVVKGSVWDIRMENGSVVFTRDGYEQDGMEFSPEQGEKKPYHIYGGGKSLDQSVTVEKGVSVELILDDVWLSSSGNDYALTLRQNAKVSMELQGENRFKGGGNALSGSVLTEKNASLEVKGDGSLALESDGGGKIVLYGSVVVDSRNTRAEENPDNEDPEEEQDENGGDVEDGGNDQNVEEGNVSLDLESGETVTASGTELSGIGYQDILSVAVSVEDKESAVTLEREVLETLADKGADLQISSGQRLEMDLDTKAVEDLLSATNGDVTLVVKPFTLTDQFPLAKKAVGSRPIFDIQVYDQGYREKRLKNVNFPNGKVVLSAPYRLARNEKMEHVALIYVGGNNQVDWLKGSYYDTERGEVIAQVQHFSVYAVGNMQAATVSGNGL